MVNLFFVTGNDGLYKCDARLVDNVTVVLGLDVSAFTYQLRMLDTPADASLDMWPEEFEYLMGGSGSVAADGWTTNTDFTTTEVLARAAVINRVQSAIATYETWPHYEDHPYTP